MYDSSFMILLYGEANGYLTTQSGSFGRFMIGINIGPPAIGTGSHCIKQHLIDVGATKIKLKTVNKLLPGDLMHLEYLFVQDQIFCFDVLPGNRIPLQELRRKAEISPGKYRLL